MLDRIDRRDIDDRMERRDRQDLVERKDLMERTDAGRDRSDWEGTLLLGLPILPQPEHCPTAGGERDSCWA
jgi:hypothetical protein